MGNLPLLHLLNILSEVIMSENTDNYNPKAEIEKIERRFEHQNFAKDFCAAYL